MGNLLPDQTGLVDAVKRNVLSQGYTEACMEHFKSLHPGYNTKRVFHYPEEFFHASLRYDKEEREKEERLDFVDLGW